MDFLIIILPISNLAQDLAGDGMMMHSEFFAYVYNGGIRTSKELGVIQIGSENTCSIKITGAHYTFSLNDITGTMARSSNTIKATGYKLYPYFGGDEAAPHDITILIKELKTD